jgi:hypothetical protein
VVVQPQLQVSQNIRIVRLVSQAHLDRIMLQYYHETYMIELEPVMIQRQRHLGFIF